MLTDLNTNLFWVICEKFSIWMVSIKSFYLPEACLGVNFGAEWPPLQIPQICVKWAYFGTISVIHPLQKLKAPPSTPYPPCGSRWVRVPLWQQKICQKLGKQGKNQEEKVKGSFTLPLLTDRAGYTTPPPSLQKMNLDKPVHRPIWWAVNTFGPQLTALGTDTSSVQDTWYLHATTKMNGTLKNTCRVVFHTHP